MPSEPRTRETRDNDAHRDVWRRRASWTAVGLCAFLAFEFALVAVALQGPWLALLAPGIVCGVIAVENYQSLRKQKSATARN